ncbi:Glycosyltransferase [Heracleum sosnowskyi]|uniref:Glycosyltransferase n=1 Tax=Heracleum sosnowskyi TaxID=360622 RepID=A0AAD8JH50_9APIA|nr:Glycosyltransferase [Heracleum sosnowskyi]
MSDLAKDLHFVLFPLMAQGHIIPMVDIARLLAQRSAIVTIITTPANAIRFKAIVTRSIHAGLDIRVAELYFPSEEVGLPKGCENFDMLSTLNLSGYFFAAISMLQEPLESLLTDLKPPANCIISDKCFPWTTNIAHKFHIPKLVFHGPCCFSILLSNIIFDSNILDEVASNSEKFVVPGLPDNIELTETTVSTMINPRISPLMKEFYEQLVQSEKEADGVVANTFEELEPWYVKEYARVMGTKVWCIGPVSLYNKDTLDKVERGKKASINEHDCLSWLGMQKPCSVVYVCLGSLSRLATSQMIELGLGLEESNRPFIWCIRYKTEEFDKWFLEEGYEERVEGKGLIIMGWAPQVLILSHQAIGGFLTHCGWNSTLEGICAGVQLLTWPMFAEQFVNEEMVVKILKIGVKVGVELPIVFGEEEKVGVVAKKEDITRAIEILMNEDEEGEDRRKRARKLSTMAKKAMEEGGSSHLNMTLLVQAIIAAKPKD